MSAKVFLDTNGVAYAFDATAPAKRQRAREIMDGYPWRVSWQVVQELANLALHRFAVPMKPADLADTLDLVPWPRCSVLPSLNLYRMAVALHTQAQYRYYECLIVAAALASDAAVLSSENLQHGRTIGSRRIENPFS